MEHYTMNNNKTLHGNYDNYKKYIAFAFCLIALLITVYVLFVFPRPGVADQGDFDRVMIDSGLDLLQENKDNPEFHRFFDFIVSDYAIKDAETGVILKRLRGMSMTSLITAISLLCKALGQNIFKTEYLAVVYFAFYLLAMILIIKYINLKSKVILAIFAALGLFMFYDGNYLVWFNSLYGEPMMITSLMLFVSAWMCYIYHRKVLESSKTLFFSILFIFAAAFVFLGSKMQVLSALPIIFIMLCVLLWDNRKFINWWQLGLFVLLLCVLVRYPIKINEKGTIIKKDTQYNSVFFGVLMDSENPRQDLISMGLNPDLAVEAGKHSYLGKHEYVRYIPHTEITEQEFYSKMNNAKLAKFYLTHPDRLILGMKYTAEKAYITSTTLGKYPESYSNKPISEFNRFTFWSAFRENYLPKNLIFIILVHFIVIAVSFVIYLQEKTNKALRAKILLFWAVILIGVLQFPMPYIGNGHADISKQLYLFNFIFDIMLLVSFCWCFSMVVNIYKSVGKRKSKSHKLL